MIDNHSMQTINHNFGDRFTQAIAAIDAANSQDPNHEQIGDQVYPKELLYAQRMSACLQQFATQASEVLHLAARSQHIRRWEIPRRDFPQGRQGYHRWRRTLYQFHADTAAKILVDLGYESTLIDRVQSLLRKENLKSDSEAQCLENVICLVFMEYYLDDFAALHEQDKIIGIIRRTWGKMSQQGQQAALQLPLSAKVQELVSAALAETS